MMNGWTGGQYSLYRGIFGFYLLIHFVALLPWSAELFSNRGVLPADASPLLNLFPNVLAVSDTPAFVATLITVGAIASLFFLLGQCDRIAAVVVWYLLACLSGRNPLIANPSLPFVGWLLLAHASLPASPYGSWSARGRTDPRGGWFMPPAIFAAAWIVMSIGYSYSGYTKLVSPSWLDGNALTRVLNNPLARPTFVRDLVLTAPAFVLRCATWGALALELTYVLLALSKRARPWIWAAMLAFHLSLMVFIDFADLSFGMVILHLFTFDPRWAPDLSGNEGKELAQWTLNAILQEGRLKMSTKRYPLVIEKTGTGYSAYSPDVAGCAAVGDTEAMRESGELIPEPSSSVDYVEVAA